MGLLMEGKYENGYHMEVPLKKVCSDLGSISGGDVTMSVGRRENW